MSGKHPGRTDVTSVSGGKCPKASSSTANSITPHYRSSLKDEEYTLAEALRDKGYFTGVFGKWHMSPDGHHFTFPLPTDQGFERAYNSRGVQTGMSDRLSGFATSDPSDPYQLDANGIAKDPVTEEALGFLAEAAAGTEPFFCYYSTWLVHSPWQVRTESLLQKYAARMGYSYPLNGTEVFAEGQNNPYYAAMVESLDYYINQLITYLKNTDDPRWPGHKLIENTYIVLTSDNGGMENGDPSGKVTDNYPLDKGKISIKEGGTRVPFIVRGPGITANAVSEVPINGLDLYPTFMTLSGEASLSTDLDGCDLSNLWLNDPQDSGQVLHHQTSAVRESLFWHFPHSGRVASTIVKDGWKLYKNYDYLWNSAADQLYSLYQLYDANGTPVDLGEMSDLIDSQTVVANELKTEIEAWIETVDARPAYLNPKKGTHPLTDQSPTILDSGHDDTVAWVSWNTDRAKVKYLDLIYTKSATADGNEEWYKVPVPFRHAQGWAEVAIPAGAQSFFFTLVDANGFFKSSVDLTGHGGYDSELVPSYSWLPENSATLTETGTTFPTDELLFHNSFHENAQSSIRDDGANLQLLGQTFTVTEPVRVSALTLQAHSDRTIGSTDLAELYLWIGRYENGAPGSDLHRTRVFEKIDMRDVSLQANHFYKIDFGDRVLLPGSYAFQLRWKAQASGNIVYWLRANGNGDFAGGDLLHILTSANSLSDFPFTNAEDAGKDLVFALHGSIDPIGGWAAQNGLDRIPKDSERNRLGSSASKNSVFYGKSNNSAWSATNGTLSNSSSSNNNVGEGAIAKTIDLSGLTASDAAQLTLSFDYTTADAGEKLYVHLWGCVELDSNHNSSIMNLGAQNGNAWVSVPEANMDVYNLSKPNGVFTGSRGTASDAAAILTGSTGSQSYSATFDLSAFSTAPDAVSDYDYLVLAFAREVGGTSTAAVTITNINLSIDGGANLHVFPRPSAQATGVDADPDGDGYVNLFEYALGGDPKRENDIGNIPVVTSTGSDIDFVYSRRRNATNQGIRYRIETTPNLESPTWSSSDLVETEVNLIDSEFETVTNRVATSGKNREFFRLVVEEL
jgi:arylsulfatase A-like enzyme